MHSIDPAIIEFANDAFYLAFNTRDLGQMEQLWAADYPCVCIHPGWSPLIGREAILDSFEGIFSGSGEGNTIIHHEPRVLPQGDLFSVVCYEQLQGGWLSATNNFVIEGGIAKIVHHQAGQCMDPPELVAQTQSVQ
jgi:ketosteroid isomerase-like protein